MALPTDGERPPEGATGSLRETSGPITSTGEEIQPGVPQQSPTELPAQVHHGPKADLKILPTTDGSLRLAGPRGGTLMPFPKGFRANPSGGRKQKEIHAAYTKLGQLTVAELERVDTTRLTVFEMAAYRQLQRTLIEGGNMVAHAAMVEVSDRVDGKVAQKIYASQGISEELDEMSNEELEERVKQLREKNQ